MSCKFKQFDHPNFCQVINGECQFINPPYDDGLHCPIFFAYSKWDEYWVAMEAQNNNGVVNIENIKSENTSNETTNLNIGK